jgi:hypothetical protein
MLIITEPAKQLVPSRAFPFGEVRFQRTQVEFTSDPEFETVPLPPPGTDELEMAVLRLEAEVRGLQETIDGGDMGPMGRAPVEDIALDESDPERANAASTFVDNRVSLRRVEDKKAALDAGGALSPVDIFFVPSEDAPIRFPVTLVGSLGEVHVDLPVVFVADVRMPAGLLHPAFSSLGDPVIQGRVEKTYGTIGDGDVGISPARIDMVLSSARLPADTPEVRRLHVVGEPVDGGFAARLGTRPVDGEALPPAARWAFEMAMPELGTLLGHQTTEGGTPALKVALSPELLSGVPEPGLLFRAPAEVPALTAAFSRNSARSGGLASPDLTIDGVARGQGPVQAASFLEQVSPGPMDPKKFLGEAASLLGFNLADLIDGDALKGAPQILADPRPGQPPKVTMTWAKVPLKTTAGPFVTNAESTLDLEVTIAPEGQKVRCTVEHVTIAFPEREDPPKLLEVNLGHIEFIQEGSAAPVLHVSDITTKFFGFLKLLDDLQDAVKFAGAAPGIHASDRGVTATFDLPVPDVTTGGFQLTGLVFHSVIDVPFDERPVTIELAFASREDPFNVSILALGGGGYVDLVLDRTGLRRLEIALEFGASIEVDFIVASGEVHAMGGIRVVDDNGFSFTGYLRLGGMVEVLGLVSVSVELLVTLTYDDTSNAMIGRATLVLEIDVLLFSEKVEIDSGDWVLAGDAPPAGQRLPGPPPDMPGLAPDAVPLLRAALGGVDPDVWRSYRSAFDEEALT